jgi:hypothetical protein
VAVCGDVGCVAVDRAVVSPPMKILIAKGYPPAFADGFDDGCVSGRQAAGSISGEFRKNVPRYLKDKRNTPTAGPMAFASARRCSKTRDREDYRNEHWDERERAWQQQKDQDAGRAYRSQ